jgi:hypothetical protein
VTLFVVFDGVQVAFSLILNTQRGESPYDDAASVGKRDSQLNRYENLKTLVFVLEMGFVVCERGTEIYV